MRLYKSRAVELRGAGALALIALVLLLISTPASAQWPGIQDWQIDWGTATNQVEAGDVPTIITNFNNNLSAADDTVQKALDTLDDMIAGLCEWTEAAGVLSPTTVTDIVEIHSTATTGAAFKVIRDQATADNAVVLIIQDNASDTENALSVRQDGSAASIYGYNTTGIGVSGISTDSIAVQGISTNACGVVGTGGSGNDDYGTKSLTTSRDGKWTDYVEQASNPAVAPNAGEWRVFFKSGGMYYIEDDSTVTGPLGSGGVSDHGLLSGLGDDDHTQYSKADGTRAFTGVVSGVTPTATAHLATKGYADGISGIRAVTTKTAAYTATTSDHVIFCDTQTTGGFTLTLPAASGNSKLDYYIKLSVTAGGMPNTLIVDPNGAELIDGAANYQLMDAMLTGIHIVCDGTGWLILTSYLAG